MKIRTSFRLATVVVFAMMLGGCSTYYQSYYPDSGVYYSDSAGYGQSYGHSGGYARAGLGLVNPVTYPYWSLDYFYFSRYYHPYSVYVGYNEPLYYPYPGWALGYYRPIRSHSTFSLGFGYPWHGYGYRYPAYSFGFFSSYDPFYYGGYYGRDYRGDRHGHRRIRQIDRRLEALQRGSSYASRQELLRRDGFARGPAGGVYDTRSSSSKRAQSRADVLRQRSAGNSSALQRRTTVPDRQAERRAPAVRSDRRVPDRDRVRRDGGGSAYEGHRGIPMERLRGRVIVNSRDTRSGDAPERDADGRRDRSGTAKIIRRAPVNDLNRGKRRSSQASGRVSHRAGTAARGYLSPRTTRRSDAPPKRSSQRTTAPLQSTRDTSRPVVAPRRSSAPPSRRAVIDNRSGNGRAMDNRHISRNNDRSNDRGNNRGNNPGDNRLKNRRHKRR